MRNLSVQIDGKTLDVGVRPNPRARRLILRIDRKSGAPVVTLPPGVGQREISRFLENSRGWLAGRLSETEDFIPLEPGRTIPLRGVPHLICHVGKLARPVLAEDGKIRVKGAAGHLSRRVHDWLKSQARGDLKRAVAIHAASLGAKPGRITVRDTTSRWGSCSAKGGLSFSWRLILAPPDVLDYVAAHEVAHLKEMNHSAGFWRHVAALVPAYDAPRKWLKTNGGELHGYGREIAPGR